MKMGPLIRALRPRQWTKNLFVFAAVVFAFRMTDGAAVLNSVIAFFLFCGLSGAVYLFNDLMDVEDDRRHPIKKNRPIASGSLSETGALLIAGLLIVVSLVLAYILLGGDMCLISLLYLGLMVLYAIILKKLVILDTITISTGFVLRAMAGAAAIDVPISSWLLVCTFLLSLLLGLGKRRSELLSSGETTRSVLANYNTEFLDTSMATTGAATIIAYALYTFFSDTASMVSSTLDCNSLSERVSNPGQLLWTIPFVVYGILRYFLLVIHESKGEEPEEILLKDLPLQLNVILWILVVLVILYMERI